MHLRIRSRAFPILLFTLVLVNAVMLAQTTGGRILGRVTDPSGAVIESVKVKLVNEQTGVMRSTETNKAGDYQFLEVRVGEYRLEFDQPGFKTNIRRGITVLVNQVVSLNTVMQLGAAREVVEVTSEAPLVDITSTQLGAVVNERSVTQLPLNSRDTYQFLQLQPGVVSQLGNNADLIYGSDQTGAVSVNGGRGRANNFSVNGGDANDQFVNLPTIQPSPDSIEEFRVLTNTFDAEYGRNSGSVVNVVTKSGTNLFHGNAYEFFRNNVLNARNFFEATRPAFKQNQFGGTFGGPVRKDRTFFFGSYEGRRVRRPAASDVVPVPSAAERGGDFSAGSLFTGTLVNGIVLNNRPGCPAAVGFPSGVPDQTPYSMLFPNNKIPFACMDGTALDLLQYVPLPNRPDGSFQGTVVGPTRGDQFTIRLDHKINDRQNLIAYYYFNDERVGQPFAFFEFGGANVPGFGSIVAERFQQWNLSHTWTLNNTSVNEFRFVYMREGQGTFQHPQRTSLVQDSCPPSLPGQPVVTTGPNGNCFTDPASPKLGITPNLGPTREGLPFIQVSGGFVIGNNSEGELPQIGNSFQWSNSFTKVSGAHTVKFGVEVRRQRFDQTLFFDVNGQFAFSGTGTNTTGFSDLFPDYLLGVPDTYGQGSAQLEKVRSTALYLFAQDSWKIKPNLTLNYGLRWELTTPIADIAKHVQTFRPGQATTIYPCQLSPQSQVTLGLSSPDCNPGSTGESVFPFGLVVPGDKGIPNAMTQTYYKAFAPRIGLAFSPNREHGALRRLTGGPGKTSIRTGWGIFYNPVEQLVLEAFGSEPPFGGSSFFSNTLFNTPFLGQGGSITPNPFNGILNPQRGQPVDWSVFRPILLFGQFQPHLRTQYASQYNLTIQRELAKDVVFQIGYVGSQGHRLLAAHDINFGNPQTCLDLMTLSGINANNVLSGPGGAAVHCGPFLEDQEFFIPAGVIPGNMVFHLPNGQTVQGNGPKSPSPALTIVGTRAFSSPFCQPVTAVGCPPDGVPVFSSIFSQDTIANSAYNSLQMMVEKRFSQGLQLQGSYTWSKSIDQASSFENILDPLNFQRTRSLSLFDARHHFVLSYFWELPIAKQEGPVGKLTNGWALSGIATFQTGFPIRITSASDKELMNSFDFDLPGEPDLVAPFRTRNAHNRGCALGTGPTAAGVGAPPCQPVANLFFDPNLFAPQALGTIGSAPRTVCCGPSINNWDIAVHKNIQTTESTHIEFRAEFFNAFNHTQFFNPDGNITNGTEFGRVKKARDPRLVQLALKYFF